MSWNIHGRTGNGTTALRKECISRELTTWNPDLVFLQECQWKDLRPQVKLPPGQKFRYEGLKAQVGFLWNEASLQGVSIPENILHSIVTGDRWAGELSLKGRFRLEDRVYAMKFTISAQPDKHFVALCVHAPRAEPSDVELNAETLLQLARRLRESYNLSVVIGGDFNFDLAIIDPPYGMIMCQVERQRENHKYLDWFLMDPEPLSPLALVDVQVSSYAFLSSSFRVDGIDEGLEYLTSHYTREDGIAVAAAEERSAHELVYALDHDPLIGNLVFLPGL